MKLLRDRLIHRGRWLKNRYYSSIVYHSVSMAVYGLALLFRQPYFGPIKISRQFIVEREVPMRRMVQQEYAAKGPLDILEVGSDSGHSTLIWSEYGKVTSVDLWANPVVSAFFDRNLKLAGRSVKKIQGSSLDVLPWLRTDFDLIYVDGSHVYRDVLMDLRNAHELLRAGGVLCGDDLHLPDVNYAVAEFFGKPVFADVGFWAMRKTSDGYVAAADWWVRQ